MSWSIAPAGKKAVEIHSRALLVKAMDPWSCLVAPRFTEESMVGYREQRWETVLQPAG